VPEPESFDYVNDQLAAVVLGVISGVVAYKLIDYIARYLIVPQNRYQVGVGSNTAATEIAPVLESLAAKGLVVADGDMSKPNERTYRIRPDLAVSS
jgi:hypothetical protein